MIIVLHLCFNYTCSYSGADIAVVCREALLRPIRRLGSATHFKRVYIYYWFIFLNLYFDFLLCRYLIRKRMVHVNFGLHVHLVIVML